MRDPSQHLLTAREHLLYSLKYTTLLSLEKASRHTESVQDPLCGLLDTFSVSAWLEGHFALMQALQLLKNERGSQPHLLIEASEHTECVQEPNYGTTEEKELTVFISPMIEDLKRRYHTVVLLRNEQFFKIYSFNDGQAFESDFVLFLQEKVDGEIIQYQVFIEPKGTNLIENDIWKEVFLLQMKDKARAKEILWENYEFRIVGLPFFNHEVRVKEFDEAITELKMQKDRGKFLPSIYRIRTYC